MANPRKSKLHIIGNATGDAEMRYTPGGKPLTNLNVAVNRSKKQQDGSFENETYYVRVTVFGDIAAERAARVKKGSSLAIEGEFWPRTYKGNDGQDRVSYEITVNSIGDIQMLDDKSKDATDTSSYSRPVPALADDGLPF